MAIHLEQNVAAYTLMQLVNYSHLTVTATFISHCHSQMLHAVAGQVV